VPEPLPTPLDIIDPFLPPVEVPLLIWFLAPITLLLIFAILAWGTLRRRRKNIDQLPVPPLINELSDIYQRFQADRSREEVHLFVKLVRREPQVLSEHAQNLLTRLEELRFSHTSIKEAEFPMKELLSILSTRQDSHRGGVV
jgi:hypothetical protein